jgi:hypothetical protein
MFLMVFLSVSFVFFQLLDTCVVDLVELISDSLYSCGWHELLGIILSVCVGFLYTENCIQLGTNTHHI